MAGFSGASTSVTTPYDTISNPSGIVPSYTSVPRVLVSGSIGATYLTSQTVSTVFVPVPAGKLITNVGFSTGGTAAVTPANWWMLYQTFNRQVIGVTADQLTNPIGTFTSFNLPLTAPVVTPGPLGTVQFMYVSLMINAATVPTLEGSGAAGLGQTAPGVQGNSSTAQTSPPVLGTIMAALTASASAGIAYMWCN